MPWPTPPSWVDQKQPAVSDDPSFDDEFNAELKRIFDRPEGGVGRRSLDGGEREWPSSPGTVSLRDRVLGEPTGLPRSKTPLLVAGFVLLLLVLLVVGVRKNTVTPPAQISTVGSESDDLPGTTTTEATTPTAPPETARSPLPPELLSTTTGPSSTTVATTPTPTTVTPLTTRRSTTTPPTKPADVVETTIVNPFAATTVPSTVPRIPVTAFLDDFAGETSEQPTSWHAEKGTWLIKPDGDAKVLRNEGAGSTETTIVSTGNDSWTAYETDARLRLGAGTTMGIAAMYHGENDYYLCQVDRANGRLELWKVVNGLRGRIGDESYIVPPDGSVLLDFTVRNGQLTCRGNDDPNAPPLVTADSKFTSGKLAIVSVGPGDIRRIEVKA